MSMPSTGDETGEINHVGLASYYYWALPGLPKITGSRKLYNTLNSVLFVLDYMEDETDYFSVNNPNNAILGFIRSVNIDYSSASSYENLIDKMMAVCGPYESSIASFFTTPYAGGGLSVLDFFASFVPPSKFNSNYHGSIAHSHLNNDLRLIDPLSHCDTST